MKKLTVVKIGGNIVDHPEKLDTFIELFSQLDGLKVLVHGGGKIATEVSKSLGITSTMIDGRRVTDQETIKIVAMVYAGLVNKSIVAKLQANNTNSIGFSGADADVIRAHKRIVKTGAVDYGFVGDVDQVDGSFLSELLNKGKTPVIAPITHDGAGQLLNTNADTVASEVAIALSTFFDITLLYAFELPGVLKDINDKNSLINEINTNKYHTLLDDGIIAKGMIPKIDNCYNAISRGVKEVLIGDALELKTLFSDNRTTGTKLTK
jgi:acetylglutamate kinase